MKKAILIFIPMLLALTGCYNAPDKVKPMSWLFNQMPEDAPNNFKAGWRDGCESGLAAMTNTMYKTFYSYKQDENLREDPTYYKAWKDTFNFCRHYAYGTIRQSNQRMNLPNKRPAIVETFMGAEGIFEAGPLQLWGPGGNTLLPFQKVGDVAGSGAWPMDIGGMGTLDFSDGYVQFGFENGMNMDYSKDVPFFGYGK